MDSDQLRGIEKINQKLRMNRIENLRKQVRHLFRSVLVFCAVFIILAFLACWSSVFRIITSLVVLWAVGLFTKEEIRNFRITFGELKQVQREQDIHIVNEVLKG